MRSETPDRFEDGRLVSPSAERNKEPICRVLKTVLPAEGLVLEISSGSGQHVAHFAREFPGLAWQPSEREDSELASIALWVADAKLTNVRPALRIDVTAQPWPLPRAAAVICINMIHIAPWEAAEALVGGAGDVVVPGGRLFLYGPFRRNGRHTAESNAAFDRSLQSRNPQWGVRNLEDVAQLAAANGFSAPDVHEMPANNLSVVFRRL